MSGSGNQIFKGADSTGVVRTGAMGTTTGTDANGALPTGPPEGVTNFRDLGGARGLGGAVVRRGVVFRSGSLEGLTPLGWEQLAELGVRTIIDLRSQEEWVSAPTRPSEGLGVEVVGLPMWQEPTGAAAFTEEVFEQLPPGTSAREALETYCDIKVAGYRAMVRTFPRVLGGVVSILARLGGRPALVHCAGGKDRTGLVCAVVLAAVGVDETEILDDYQRSRESVSSEPIERYRGGLERFGIRLEDFLPICGAHRPALIGALEEISAIGGSVGGYLCGPGGVHPAELERLRSTLLDAAVPGDGKPRPDLRPSPAASSSPTTTRTER